ncbi:MAG: hypothetical protein NTU58_00745 [Candidatus Nealsonbacteria bacterium]|nr:hypothetical protein [Candidatus Nealsonbacteria bacterium]
MAKTDKKQSIILQFLIWYLIDKPGAILKAWRNLLLFNLNYFSILLLLKTFFSPWRKYKWPYCRGFDFKIYLEAFFSNAIMRFIGASLRLFLIIFGIILEFFIILIGISALIIWFFLPFILISFFILGFDFFI